MIGGRRQLTGRKAGDRRVRIERPHAPFFRYTGPGQLVAREAASQPRTRTGRALARARAVVFGRPLSNEADIEERLDKKKALAIFSSDAISSSAYATEEILRVLVLGGAAAMLLSIQVSIAIALLLAVVALSYRQVCRAYPNGGGAYVVARTNLAPIFGLIAAASLLIDYVMTVAVSTASAIAQIQSVIPAAYDIRIEIAFVSISLITIANLRGLRESGNIFAIPTYLFVGLALAIVAIAGSQVVLGRAAPIPEPPAAVSFGTEAIGILLLLKAFAGGSVALTGVEAIANGVPAFKPPESKNAADTMTIMAVLLGILFVGLTIVAVGFGLRPTEAGGPSVVAMAAEVAFGSGSPLVPVFAASTALILFLAANTSFNAFPRLAAILAEDGYMPRQFAFRGDRLAYSWGIALLATIAFGLLWAFGGDTHALIPLYSVGVFLCFTLSQVGMVRHWRRVKGPGWRWRLAINAGGAVLTAVVLTIVVGEKFRDGAYLVVILVPVLVGMMLFISRQYARARAELARPARQGGPTADPRGAGRGARSRASTGRRSRRSTSGGRSATTSGRCSSPTTPRTPLGCARTSSARCRVSRWSWSNHPTGRSRDPCSPTSTSSTWPGRRTSRSRSRSSSSPSTSPRAGGSGCSTTSPPSGCARCCSGGPTRSSSTCRTGATIRICTPNRRSRRRRRRAPEPAGRAARQHHPPRAIRRALRVTRTNSVKWRRGRMWLASPA